MTAGWMSGTQCPDELQVTEYFPISASGQVSTHFSLLLVAAADQMVSKVPGQPKASPRPAHIPAAHRHVKEAVTSSTVSCSQEIPPLCAVPGRLTGDITWI